MNAPSPQIDLMLNSLIAREGGYVNNPADPGGATCWGITEAVARGCGFTGDMKDFTKGAAYTIYRVKYYIAPGYDQVYAISPQIAEALVDTGVNQGLEQGTSFLQRSLNVFNTQSMYPVITVDDLIGKETLYALSHFLAVRGTLGEIVMLKALACLKGARYIMLGEKNVRLDDFEFGWFANRVTLP